PHCTARGSTPSAHWTSGWTARRPRIAHAAPPRSEAHRRLTVGSLLASRSRVIPREIAPGDIPTVPSCGRLPADAPSPCNVSEPPASHRTAARQEEPVDDEVVRQAPLFAALDDDSAAALMATMAQV